VIAAIAVQSDPALVQELEQLVTTQVVIAISLSIVALAVLGVAVGILLAIRKTLKLVDRTSSQLQPRLDPILTNVSRITDDAEDVASAVKHRVNDVLKTVDDLNERVKTGADAVEARMKKLVTVVDVVQEEAEEILLDAASTARGVHTASEVLRSGRRERLPRTADDDEFTE
jgi:flagellar motility protein MotE (MotC chaperone)